MTRAWHFTEQALRPVEAAWGRSSRSVLTAGSRPSTWEQPPGRARRCSSASTITGGLSNSQPGWPDHDPEVVDQGTGLTDTLPWARRTLLDAGLEDDVVLVVGESSAVARSWHVPLSLLFIDGGHGERVAWQDFRCWSPKVAPGGTLAIHDVFADPKDGGQVPYDIYRAALSSAQFVGAGALGSLRFLRRLAAS